MPLQIANAKKPEHMRAFNPDRDLVWAMPRLLSRVLHQLGDEWTVDAFWELQCKYGIDAPDERGSATVIDRTLEVAKGLARMFNLMQQFPEKRDEHAAEYKRLKELCPAFMTLIGAMLMDTLVAELPFWFDQVRPVSKLAPTPNIEEVEDAARKFLERSNQG